MKSITYWNRFFYQLVIKLLYQKNYHLRYSKIAELIEDNSTLVDLCCGDCQLAQYLKPNQDYTGIDINQNLSKGLKKIKVLNIDITQSWNDATYYDYVIMMGSLHQFIPHHDQIINKMKKHARKKVIISEPFKNLASSQNKIIRFFANLFTNPGVETSYKRFDIEQLNGIAEKHNAQKTYQVSRDFIFVIDPKDSKYEQ